MSPMLIRDLTLIILAISVACRRLSRNFQTSRPGCSCHILGSGFDSGPPCLWCVIWPLTQHQIARGNITGVHTIDNRNCGAKSDGVFAWELADYGVDSVGCGLSDVELFKCTSRVPMTSC